MKGYFLPPFLLFLGLMQALAQQPSPTLPPADDQAVKINTNLIQIDVTVVDKNGKVVSGLKPEDFELYENGQLQKITNFAFVSKMKSGASIGGDQSQEAQTPSNAATAPLKRGETRRTIALVVDDLNLSFPSVYYTRKALNKFVDEQMLPGDLVAIIRTGGGVGALQQFTSDKQLLKAAIA
jgi:VWFA-related protein